VEIPDPEELHDEPPIKVGLFKKIVFAVIALDILVMFYFLTRR
jgi:hypothetical protein